MENQGVKIQWKGQGSIDFFSKKFDGAYIYEDVGIGARAVRTILMRQYEYMSRNLYFITFFSRFILGPERESEIIKAEDAVLNFIRKAMKSLEDKIGQMQHLMQESQISDNQNYSKKEEIQVPITTQGSKLYLNLLLKADKYYSLNNLLWLQGEIDTKAKFENERAVRREVNKVVQQVANRFGEMLKMVRNKDSNVAALAGDHDEGKLITEITGDHGIESPAAETAAAELVAAEAAPATKKAPRGKKAAETATAAA